ncbi:hypothetical protein PV332_10585 [Streptomyces scabiei]|uniref:hypothetical protein n=1 Tax=Streptomyces scabiei TaxID=1930 RepID=UPI0029BBD8B1|nr:hypothetical protein [Streptomyces scabiei]MDX2575927.1 hypothetical protein [Streptomyces scabiei]MDX2794034.1 hypothetical protein [Streptomyces scabiei]MDX2885600.1 hypothetical protein [Streptomyces scabiei]MDX2993447.1 hypothetical protein [Streptomyces scabiei]MDX3028439.1 hypothetical protein [Streptomyces scabiei]
MGKARLTDFTGAEIRPGVVIAYPTRQGNVVRNSEALVLETLSDKSTGRVVPMLKVRPTGRDSGFIARKTLAVQKVSAEHVVVIADTNQGESK